MLSLVIPAYNEEKRILRTLEAYIDTLRIAYEIVVVPNGCTDKTVKLVQKFIENHPDVPLRSLVIPEAVGKGGAVRRGLAAAKGTVMGFVDADLATPVEDVIRMYQLIQDSHVDGVIASRLLPDSQVHGRGILRGIASHLFAGLVRFITDLEYRDTQCGAKLFKREALAHILPELTTTDMTIDVDLLLAARKHGLTVIETKSEWYDRADSAQLGSPIGLFKSGVKMFFTLIKLQRKYE
ncbi:MAG: glycosyl transferase [Candidatus Kerfeldbacteria bacterium CG08_land_8_20_14_0_20_42_7]|uniref:Glycosyl transferase n=1 Tax=Candidatus Kerfeldbacteria bacterium CG08_land_8_20_14_0_20_42_7 TaxID=2014245 RepID=A0A2H0YRY2_9BACT|nr:MAG: glycosyl transferase [Candidatus Kerfeldbacteria bacterium CG08_land_8_20_14_0_20_42_7]